MSVRYINDRFLPDKAIDIIDEAASKVQLAGYHPSPEAEELEREIHEILKEKRTGRCKRGPRKRQKGSGQTEQRRG